MESHLIATGNLDPLKDKARDGFNLIRSITEEMEAQRREKLDRMEEQILQLKRKYMNKFLI